MAAKKRKSKTPWGWIAFGVGLAICVGAGGVVGVMLGQSDGPDDGDAERVAALALDTKGLNEDALSLSRAIEEAIAREELETEAESLRTELARLETRAERIRVRAESEAETVEVREASGEVQRGIGEISDTVTVFERDVVDHLEPVLDEPSSVTAPVGEEPGVPDPSFEEALADVTQVLEEQGEAMRALAENLEESDEGAEKSTTEGTAAQEEDLVSGSFEGALVPPDSTLEIGYELESLEPEVDGAAAADESEAGVSGADPEEATIVSAPAGELTLKNTGPGRESFELPTFHLVLYWKESDVPRAARDAELRLGSSTEEGLEVEGSIEEGEGADEGEAAIEGDAGTEGSAPCRYEIEGDVHCALASLAFDRDVDHERNAAGELVMRPDDEIAVELSEPDGSLSVRAGEAGPLVNFIGSQPPDLVQVLASGSGDFRPACAASTDSDEAEGEAITELEGSSDETQVSHSETTTTLGLLTGDGRTIFEAENAGRPQPLDSEGVPDVPACYIVTELAGVGSR